MRAYFVLSFLLVGIMAALIGVNAWNRLDWPWQLLALAAVPIAGWSFLMALVALVSTYRR